MKYQAYCVYHVNESLKWTGLSPDEGPGFNEHKLALYSQSNRFELYKKFGNVTFINSMSLPLFKIFFYIFFGSLKTNKIVKY
jgi:hypothetical protein